MSSIVPLRLSGWAQPVSSELTARALAALERGDVLYLPELAFRIEDAERSIFSPAILSTSKNTSFDPESRRIGGTTLEGEELEQLRRLMVRFSDAARAVVDNLCPRYRGKLGRARASFRPAEIEGRASSWRKDDSRLHVDSFPATPVQGRRILRLFTNVNPSKKVRSWRIGGDFEATARRFAGSLAEPWPGSAQLMRMLGLTKSERTAYDSMMLALHDRMKQDAEFQRSSPQTAFDFPTGTTWVAFTDQVSHAAMKGQYQLEQTFLLPVDAMEDPSRSPLRVLERLKGRRLA